LTQVEPPISGVALVTGAGRNIGRAIALELARRGCEVGVLVGSDAAAAESVAGEIEAFGRRAVPIVADISDPKQARGAVARVEDGLGPVRVLVNNAAVRPTASFTEVTDEEWHRVISINLYGPFYLCKAVVPGMIDQRAGSIINISGTGAYTGGVRAHHSNAAKAGLQSLTKSLGIELGPYGIRVNTVVLSSIDTLRKLPSASRPPEIDEIPLRRKGRPEDVANVVAFLASPESAYITASAIHVNGGRLPNW
jgi:3-oxoacyl-[acyl-carrier protein] reductase